MNNIGGRTSNLEMLSELEGLEMPMDIRDDELDSLD